jgi:hypothetical protein
MREYPSGRAIPVADPGVDDVPATARPPREAVEALRRAAAHAITRASTIPVEPEARLAERTTGWWDLARRRHVLVIDPETATARQHILRPATFRRMALRALRDRFRIERAWRRLGREYRGALPGLVGPETWRRTLGLDRD